MTEEEFARQFHSKGRARFVSAMPCCTCGVTPSENHHIRTEGMGRKANYKAIVPLCRRCHRRYHQIGKLSMLQSSVIRGLDLDTKGRYSMMVTFDQFDDLAEAVERMWLREQERHTTNVDLDY